MARENEQNHEEMKMPPAYKSFQITRMGLPLSNADNFKCALVLILTAVLQIRLQSTILAEGWIVFFGLAGYIVMRYWLLRHRYPEVGEIELTENEMILPACINNGEKKALPLSEISQITTHFWRGRSGPVLSSVNIVSGQKMFRINWLGLDLEEFERGAIAHGLPAKRSEWSPNKAIALSMLVALAAIFSFVFFNEFMK